MNKMGEPVKQFFPNQVDSDIRSIYLSIRNFWPHAWARAICLFRYAGRFPSLPKRGTVYWDLPEEQFLQCAGRNGHTILLLHGIDRDFSAVAKMTGN